MEYRRANVIEPPDSHPTGEQLTALIYNPNYLPPREIADISELKNNIITVGTYSCSAGFSRLLPYLVVVYNTLFGIRRKAPQMGGDPFYTLKVLLL